MISQSNISNYQQQNENFDKITIDQIANVESSSHVELSQIIQYFDKINIKEIIESTILPENDLDIAVDEINEIIFEISNKGIEHELEKQQINDYFNNYNTNSKEIYHWLLNNQNSSNSIFLLGYFNFNGIETSENNEKAFKLFINASEQDHVLASFYAGICYQYEYGTKKNE